MTTQITLTLEDETYSRALHLAQLTGRAVADILADTLDISLLPVGVLEIAGRPIMALSDAEVLALADSQMNARQDRRLSHLLEKQQADKLGEQEAAELLTLMAVYQDGLLRKAQALREAVHRGLRQPLEP